MKLDSENRFGLQGGVSLTLTPEQKPGAARIAKLRQVFANNTNTCLFSEPQFSSQTLNIILEGKDTQLGILDPLGADIPEGPALYETLMRRMASSFAKCLRAK